MHSAALGIVLAALAGLANAADLLDALVAKDPIAEASRAFAAGDRRHIVLPVCGKESGEVIPGWPLHDSPRVQAAMNAAQRPLSCADFDDDPKHRKFIRAVKYAERYNQQLLKLEDGK
jgi:hypothetical protein